jgi:hypothetical protein
MPIGDKIKLVSSLEFDPVFGSEVRATARRRFRSRRRARSILTSPGSFWARRAEVAIGDITGEIASLEWDVLDGWYPKIIHVSGDVYAIAYEGPGFDGWLKTVTINSSGVMALTGQSLEFIDTGEGGIYPDIIHVSGDVYAIAYSFGSGWLKTVTINSSGVMALTGQLLEYDADVGKYPDLIHVSGDVYAIAYVGPGFDGWLKTVTINSSGVMALTGESLEFEAVLGMYSDIIHVSGDVYAITYQGSGNDGWLKTVTINSSGVMVLTGESLEFDTTMGLTPDIIHVSGDVYAIAHVGPGFDGWLKTVTINSSGVMVLTGESLEFEAVSATRPVIIHVSGDVYAIVYEGFEHDGWLKTVTINSSGVMALTGESLEFDMVEGRTPVIIHVLDDVYAIAYTGPEYDGWLKTIGITTSEVSAAHQRFTGGMMHRAVH